MFFFRDVVGARLRKSLFGAKKNQQSGMWYCGVYPISPGVVAPSMHASLAPTTVYSFFTSYSLHATELFYYTNLLLLLAKH